MGGMKEVKRKPQAQPVLQPGRPGHPAAFPPLPACGPEEWRGYEPSGQEMPLLELYPSKMKAPVHLKTHVLLFVVVKK